MTFPARFTLFLLPAMAPALTLAENPATSESHVIFISADGMRPDAVDALGLEKAPTFHRLRREGAWTDNARTDVVYTVTLPNHTAMVTGRGVTGPTGHAWIINGVAQPGVNLHTNRKSYVASFFDVAHDHGLATALYASKEKFSLYDLSYNAKNGAADTTGEDDGRDKLDRYAMEKDTVKLVEILVADLAVHPANAIMLHLRDPDSGGHAESWNVTPGSPYLQSVARIDQLVGKVLAAIDASPKLKDNTWVILTADHGGLGGTKGHGEAKQRDNFTIPFYVWGPGVPAGADLYDLNAANRRDPGAANPAYDAPLPPIRNGDAGNLILSLLKLPPIPGSTLNAGQDLVVTKSLTGTAGVPPAASQPSRQ